MGKIRDNKRLCIITIADAITPTSMPINEHVIYRAKNNNSIRQVLIVCTQSNFNGVEIPSHVKVYFVGSSVKLMKDSIKNEIRQSKDSKEDYVFHIHAQKSSLVYILATLFLGVRNRTMFTIHSLCSVRNLKYRLSSYICTLYANYVTCVSDAVFYDYPKWIRRIKGERMVSIVNAIDLTHLDVIKKGLPDHYSICDMHRLICIDRIVPLKNQSFLIRVLKQLPNSTLVLVGSSDKAFEKYVKEEGLENRVEYIGLVNRDRVYEELNKSGIYVTASTIEGLHNSVIEAMAIGTIPVISSIPAHNEIAKKMLLINTLPFDENAWVKEIKRIQNTNISELRSLSNELSLRVKEEFDLDKMHERFHAMYIKMLDSLK